MQIFLYRSVMTVAEEKKNNYLNIFLFK